MHPGHEVDPNTAALICEIRRLASGGTPHAPGSPAAEALNRAVHRCAQEAELASFAALARKAFSAAAAQLVKPLNSTFEGKRSALPRTVDTVHRKMKD